MSFHKFSLAPLIPGVVDNSNLADLHDKMMREQIDYVTFQTGSKISQEGNGDAVVREDGSVDNSVPFTKNIRKSRSEIDLTRSYSLDEAILKLQDISFCKFDETFIFFIKCTFIHFYI